MYTFTSNIEEKTLCCESQSCKYSRELRWYPGEGDGNPIQYSWGFPGGSDGKESACNEGDLDLIPGLGRSPGEGNGNPLQHSCLENSMDRRARQATVHGFQHVAPTMRLLFEFPHETGLIQRFAGTQSARFSQAA